MIPKVAGKGASFVGAGLYYLHDKGAQTSERVAYTETLNLPTNDPELAIKIMAHTAMHQAQIKAANDQPATGRKLTKPVYAYSLSWAPDELPTQEAMLEAARETLDLLDLTEHEALFVIHTDTEHPHIHIIANRVNPNTGIAAGLSKDHLKLSRWAEAYERKQGEIRCEHRVENNQRRDRGEFVKDASGLDQAAFRRWRRDRLESARRRREIEGANLSATHKGERLALFDQKERMIRLRFADIKAEHKGDWRDLFAAQRAELRQLQEVQKSALAKLVYVIRNTDLVDPGFKGAMKAVFGKESLERKLADKHEAQRQALGRRINERRKEAVRLITRAHEDRMGKLKEQQRAETEALRHAHSEESQSLARYIAQDDDRKVFAREQGKTVSEEFKKRVGKRIRRARKRDEEGRGKGLGRERE